MAYVRVVDFADLANRKPRLGKVDGVAICIVRVGDAVKAVHDTCSHQEFSLAEGSVYDNTVECALHGSCFDLDTGAPTGLPATTAIPVYSVRVVDGAVEVDVVAQTNDAPVPNTF